MANEYEDATELLETYDFLLKIIIIGEAGTGKSCLLHHFTQNRFKDQSQHTIGVEFSSRTVKLGEKKVKLQVIVLRTCTSVSEFASSYGIQLAKRDSGGCYGCH